MVGGRCAIPGFSSIPLFPPLFLLVVAFASLTLISPKRSVNAPLSAALLLLERAV